MAGSHTQSGFRLLGFPLRVRSGFVVFMVLIAVLHANEYGLWLAGSLAVFTVLHELGHAVVARRAGAEAEISLEFMAGFTSYRPTRAISLPTQAAITLAGPLTHIAAGALGLAILGHGPLRPPDGNDVAAQAIWWAGPMIGLFNLIPVLPLDGGNVVTTILERFLPADRARRFMIYASIVITAAVAVSVAFSERTRSLTVFIGLLLLMQLQALYAERAATAVSPLDRARDALAAGDRDKATKVLVTAMRRPAGPQTPRPMSASEAYDLVALLPRPLPTGDPSQEYVLGSLLVSAREYEEAAHYAAASFQRHPQPVMATLVARAAARLGDDGTAVAWLRAAAERPGAGTLVARVIDAAPELATLRHHPDVMALRYGAPTT